VMNLVAVLIAPAVVKFSVGESSNMALRVVIAVIAVLIIAGAVAYSKRRSVSVGVENGTAVRVDA